MQKIGSLIGLVANKDYSETFKRLAKNGLECCQITVWDPSLYTDENANKLLAAAEETGIEISTIWAGWTGPGEWNFIEGPATLGLVPPAYRAMRAEQIIEGGRFAKKLGVHRVATHAGFLPENCNDPEYRGIIAVLRYIAKELKKMDINFLFETGQETPTTLLRVIEDIGMDNVGINLDTGNLILYGKASPADAVTVFGKYVMDTHIKDGFYPTTGKYLGREVKVGEGLANLPEVIRRLKEVNYNGNLVIEREIGGEQQTKDVLETIAYLKKILSEVESTQC